MDYLVSTEQSIAEVLVQLEEGLRQGGWEVWPPMDLASRLSGMEGPFYVLEAIHEPAGSPMVAGIPGEVPLHLGRFLLYEEDQQTVVALLDLRPVAPLRLEPPSRPGFSEPWEELRKLLRSLGQPVDTPVSPDRFNENVLRRLSRIEGQIRGLRKMLEENRECDAILTQLAAVNGALKQVAALLISTYIRRCLQEELEQGGNGSAINWKLLNILF